jgi:iron complex transport system permease protein
MKPLPLLMFVLIFILVMLVSLALGKYPLPLAEIINFFIYKFFGRGTFDPERLRLLENLIIEIRLPRIITASLIGAALSVSGAAYQAIFINPLVSPGILGVLAGASFGAALGMVFLKSWYAVQISTMVGGFAAVGVAIGIARIYKVNSTIMLVLGGIISGALFTSLLSIVKYLSDPYNQLPAIVYWLMGNTSMADREMALKCGIPICIGILCLIFMSRYLNVLSMGDEEAKALGVNVELVRMTVIICATVISTLTVVMAGIIGWVGLIIPHIVRMIVGPDNETLIPATVFIGASYLLIVDDISRLAFNFEIPIGIVTALVGIPFFILVLKNAKKGWQ